MSADAYLVLDLGFGDAGKGSVTDFLVRDREADLVVRFNGGAQAGHNVVLSDGRHHTFAQFGSGSFVPGVATLLGPAFLLHPLAMVVESEHLEQMGVYDAWERTAVHEDARIITPYQQATNRAREHLRGDDAHGSCGVGIGECVADSLQYPEDTLRARHMFDRAHVRRILARQCESKRAELMDLGWGDLAFFEDRQLIERVLERWGYLYGRLNVVSEDAFVHRLANATRVVFEGAQGVLLDETWGFHPHTTWSDCVASDLERLWPNRSITRLGLTRAFMVRHGRGPFPTEQRGPLWCETHNVDHGWQGRFRTGALDAVLLRYALEVCGGVDGVVVTCLDRTRSAPVCNGYAGDAPDPLVQREHGMITRLIPGVRHELPHREALGRLLGDVSPCISHADVVSWVAEALRVPVVLTSTGPTAADKRWNRELRCY